LAKSFNPVHRLDIVFSIDRGFAINDIDSVAGLTNDVKDVFREYCNNWVFQLECPDDSENYHYQCRINLKKKKLSAGFAKLLEEEFRMNDDSYSSPFYRVDVSPTNKNPKTSFSYVMKEETRLAGPWSDRPVYQGEDIITDLFPYQNTIFEDMTNPENWDSRKIYHVYDPKGGHGISSLVKKLAYEKNGQVGFIPTCSSAQQLTSSLVKGGPKSLYVIDLPRVGMSWEEYTDSGEQVRRYSPKWAEIVMVIETLKNGGPLVDTMHGRNEMLIMKCPNIVIFSNWPLEKNGEIIFQKID
jgi:hypothetical protein